MPGLRPLDPELCMAKLTMEQIMVGAQMVERGLPRRQLAAQLGVTEGASGTGRGSWPKGRRRTGVRGRRHRWMAGRGRCARFWRLWGAGG